jgi:hypothetical protein
MEVVGLLGFDSPSLTKEKMTVTRIPPLAAPDLIEGVSP